MNNIMTLGEAMDFADGYSDYHTLEVQIPGVARFCFYKENFIPVLQPIEGEDDCWSYVEGIDISMLKFNPNDHVYITGIGEDIVLAEFIQDKDICSCKREAINWGYGQCLQCVDDHRESQPPDICDGWPQDTYPYNCTNCGTETRYPGMCQYCKLEQIEY